MIEIQNYWSLNGHKIHVLQQSQLDLSLRMIRLMVISLDVPVCLYA